MDDSPQAEQLVDTAAEQAAIAITGMSNAECVEFTRFIIEALHNGSVVADPTEDPVITAVQSLYAMELFRLSFIQAYAATDEHIKNVQKIKRSFEL